MAYLGDEDLHCRFISGCVSGEVLLRKILKKNKIKIITKKYLIKQERNFLCVEL